MDREQEESVQLWDELPNDVEIWFAACGEDRARMYYTIARSLPKITLFELNNPDMYPCRICRKMSQILPER